MSETTIKFENIVTGETIKISRRPAIEAYIKSGDLHKNAKNYDLGWRVDPAVRAEWERRYNDKSYIRAVAKDKKMNPLSVDMFAVIDFYLDELFEIDELEGRADSRNTFEAEKDYLKRVAEAGAPAVKTPVEKPAVTPKATTPQSK